MPIHNRPNISLIYHLYDIYTHHILLAINHSFVVKFVHEWNVYYNNRGLHWQAYYVNSMRH